jgi:hypothetical protein
MTKLERAQNEFRTSRERWLRFRTVRANERLRVAALNLLAAETAAEKRKGKK